MTSKTAASDKRAALPKQFSYAKQFIKDFESLNRANRTNMSRVKELRLLLVGNDGPLAADWKDHALEGEWKGFRDAHAKGDLVLIYRYDGEDIVFERLGTHSQLF